MKNKPWYIDWFNEDYLNLYANRNEEEAISQVEFLFDALQLKGKERILDLGCGTGRHALLFALKGMTVIGLDASTVLISKAKKQLENYPGINIKFLTGDMRDLKGLGFFDLVVSIFTSFGYFDTDEENEKVLSAVSECLVENGQFFLDYLHPDRVRSTHVPYEEKWVNNERVEIHKKILGSFASKEIRFPHKTYREKVRLYSRNELETMLIKHHLYPISVWNDYQGTPWRADGERQLFYCRKN